MTKQPGNRFRTIQSIAAPLLLILICVLITAGPVQAQQAPVETLAELKSKVQPGDRIQLTDKTGRKVKGKVDGISATSIRLIASGKPYEFLEPEIREIRVKRPERRGDGAVIGLAIGVVAAIITTIGACNNDSECTGNAGPLFVGLFGGIGAGAGELADIASNKHDTIYRSLAATSGLRVKVAPILSTKRKAVALSFSF